jgi:hypothetical protein
MIDEGKKLKERETKRKRQLLSMKTQAFEYLNWALCVFFCLK